MQIDHLINGRPVAGRDYFQTVNPATQEVLAEVAAGGEAEVNAAVAAAKEAFPKWAALPAPERARLMRKLGDLIAQMHSAADAGDLDAFRELDFTFHRSVVEASGNSYLPKMWDIIEPGLRSMHVLGDPSFEGDWHEVADWHWSLLDLLDGDDPAAASALFRAHAAGTLLEEPGTDQSR